MLTDPTQEAKQTLTNAEAGVARMFLSLRPGRDFFFGITDLLRLRVIPALGYLRIQSETAAPMKIMAC